MGNGERSFDKFFNETLGKAQPAQHNQQIVENIENYNSFFLNNGVELAKMLNTKKRYEFETDSKACCAFQ